MKISILLKKRKENYSSANLVFPVSIFVKNYTCLLRVDYDINRSWIGNVVQIVPIGKRVNAGAV